MECCCGHRVAEKLLLIKNFALHQAPSWVWSLLKILSGSPPPQPSALSLSLSKQTLFYVLMEKMFLNVEKHFWVMTESASWTLMSICFFSHSKRAPSFQIGTWPHRTFLSLVLVISFLARRIGREVMSATFGLWLLTPPFSLRASQKCEHAGMKWNSYRSP